MGLRVGKKCSALYGSHTSCYKPRSRVDLSLLPWLGTPKGVEGPAYSSDQSQPGKPRPGRGEAMTGQRAYSFPELSTSPPTPMPRPGASQAHSSPHTAVSRMQALREVGG